MFPLGSVLFPSIFLPLHVFEPRYRALARDCMDGDREFGVVLIERGSEVGGDDVRTSVGTVAQIVEASELDDGRWLLATVGTRRIRVNTWFDDDPYPRADVEDWPDEPTTNAAPDVGDVAAVLRRVLALKAELGEPAAPTTFELSGESSLASLQMAALAPLGPADQHALLAVPATATRLTNLDGLLRD